MKKTAYILLLILLFGCKSDNHIGSWIQSENLINPTILNIYPDSLYAPFTPWMNPKLYKIKGDTLLVESFNKIEKSILKCIGDTLIISAIDNDSLYIKYERNIYHDKVDFFNKKLNLSIQLPQLKLPNMVSFNNCNVFLLDYDDSQNLRIYFNGSVHVIDSNSYIKILPDEENMGFLEQNFVFADKEILYQDIRTFKKELGKGQRFRLRFLSKATNDSIYSIESFAIRFKGKYPDSLNLTTLPPLPQLDLANFKTSKALIGFFSTKIEYNGSIISEIELKDSLKNNINRIDKFVCLPYFADELTLELYLNRLRDLYDIYGVVRNEYSNDNYDMDYAELDDSTMKVVKSKIARRILEIDKDEYERIKNKL